MSAFYFWMKPVFMDLFHKLFKEREVKKLFTQKNLTASWAIFVLQSIEQWHQTREWIFECQVLLLKAVDRANKNWITTFWLENFFSGSSNFSLILKCTLSFFLLLLVLSFRVVMVVVKNVKLVHSICTTSCHCKKIFYLWR